MTLEEIFNDMAERKLRYNIITIWDGTVSVEVQGKCGSIEMKVSYAVPCNEVVQTVLRCYREFLANAPTPMLSAPIEAKALPEPEMPF